MVKLDKMGHDYHVQTQRSNAIQNPRSLPHSIYKALYLILEGVEEEKKDCNSRSLTYIENTQKPLQKTFSKSLSREPL